MTLRLPLSALLVAALACTGTSTPSDPLPPEPISHEIPPPPPPPPPPASADTGGPQPIPGGDDALVEVTPEPAPEEAGVWLRVTHRVSVSKRRDLSRLAERRLGIRAKAMGYDRVEDVALSNRRCTQRYCTVTATGLAVSDPG